MPKISKLNCKWCKPHYDDETKRRERLANTEYVRTVCGRELRECIGPKCATIYLV